MGLSSYLRVYVIYVTWAEGICLICTHEPKGAQRPRVSAYTSFRLYSDKYCSYRTVRSAFPDSRFMYVSHTQSHDTV